MLPKRHQSEICIGVQFRSESADARLPPIPGAHRKNRFMPRASSTIPVAPALIVQKYRPAVFHQLRDHHDDAAAGICPKGSTTYLNDGNDDEPIGGRQQLQLRRSFRRRGRVSPRSVPNPHAVIRNARPDRRAMDHFLGSREAIQFLAG